MSEDNSIVLVDAEIYFVTRRFRIRFSFCFWNLHLLVFININTTRRTLSISIDSLRDALVICSSIRLVYLLP